VVTWECLYLSVDNKVAEAEHRSRGDRAAGCCVPRLPAS